MELTYPGGAIGTVLEFPVSGWDWTGLTAAGVKIRIKRPDRSVLSRTGNQIVVDTVRGVVGWKVVAGDFDQAGRHEVRVYDIRTGIAPTLTSTFQVEADFPD